MLVLGQHSRGEGHPLVQRANGEAESFFSSIQRRSWGEIGLKGDEIKWWTKHKNDDEIESCNNKPEPSFDAVFREIPFHLSLSLSTFPPAVLSL